MYLYRIGTVEPSHLKGKAKKEVKELIKEEILLEKSTCYGIQVSLNSEKLKEITQYLED